MQSLILQILFWISVGAVVYVYVGYSVLIFLIGRIFGKPVSCSYYEPAVSVIVTAFNEEESIRDKIENTLSIDYPKRKLEIIVASDGSTDRTDDIVREYTHTGLKLYRQEGRLGKTATQNGAVEQANGEIILFSDATTVFPTDILQRILPNFADSTVGCVAGRLIYVDSVGSAVGRGVSSYWNYETSLRESESKACSLIGVSGCLYAVRKSTYRPLNPDACSDFSICSVIYRQGLRSVFDSNAVCFEETNSRSGNELRMRVRVIAQTFGDLWRERELLNPLRWGLFSIQLISHKLLRYTIPFFLIMAFITSLTLFNLSPFYKASVIVQTLFYGAAFSGLVLERFSLRSSLLALPQYFVIANLASLAGFYRFLTGAKYRTWNPVRGQQSGV
jgi:cellulose synthase/poly-beta-1,6-N-acetylglucosamine synthase-like glycosyltransferase